MEIDWESFINFPKDIKEVFMPFFTESFESLNVENSEVAKSAEIVIGELEDIIMSSNNSFIEDNFDDWEFVDKFINAYCLERGFRYQIYRNDKDPNDHTITRHKSFRCSLDEQQIRCTTLVNLHNHELNPTQIAHLNNARYQQFNENMIQDLSFFTGCNVAPITQLEILKKKYPQHIFYKQDVYNAIYSLNKNTKDEDFDSGLLFNSLFEKMTEDPNWRVFVRHSGNE
ncbi:hypothetical protein GLOIN_2v1764241 [Rhizophagus irregularis DAOM 181602=DAOM 197198]|nr:hypothetical protein GLOIN_2v1764241 [Rhizophagus irregularis DAOM 181602=DAOM 197198]